MDKWTNTGEHKRLEILLHMNSNMGMDEAIGGIF